MAANNYFGFTTGGTQYGSATPTAANYTTPQQATAGYTVQHSAQPYAAAATAQRSSQSAYETYQQPTHTTANYPYASRQQTTYDKAQAYYQTQVPYSTTETPHYQSVSSNKPVYSTTTNVNYNTRQAPSAKAQTQTAQPAANTYMYSTGASSGNSANNYSSAYNSSAATTTYSASMYVQQSSVAVQPVPAAVQTSMVQPSQQVQAIQSSNASAAPKNQGNNWMSFKKGPVRMSRPKLPPKPQQLHYCEVCKISCAGPQTYREHLEGQKHKKKEAAAKTGTVVHHVSRGGTTLKCELCDVTCTGSDAYAAHIRGAKHQKVVKLHTKLGKPIPSTEPQVVQTGTNNSTTPSKAVASKTAPASAATKSPAAVKKAGPPKITFVAATKVDDNADIRDETDDDKDGSKDDDVQPVGQDYIDEIKNEEGKVVSFQCKLCECKFNDPNAKEMHMKGRRHRLQYKKKVNPDLVVDIKPSLRHRKIQEDRLRRQQMMDDYWKRREEERWREEMRLMEEEERMYWEERRRYEEEMELYDWHRRCNRDARMGPPPMPPPPPHRPYMMGMPIGMGPQSVRRPDTVDDRHVVAKHTQIYPKEEELNSVQKIITNSEKALKLVSDYLTDKIEKKDIPKVVIKIEKDAKDKEAEDGTKEKEAPQPYRVLKGVMRVGVLAKGLVLTGDLSVQLVVMCAEKPTRSLLEKVMENLPKQLTTVAPEDKYEVKRCLEEAAIIVNSVTEPKITVTVTLTSPVMREDGVKTEASGETVSDPPDVLDRQKCLDALAALRHAKWFQARASGLQSCVMVIRILRDLCQRVPTWSRLNGWAMELLVEKALSSSSQSFSPGDALRRVFEAIAHGILLPGSAGLLDPCEKDPTDAASNLTNQEREDITASAQHALRLIAFRQIHKVLGMDPLPPPKFTRGTFPRKRRRDNSTSEDKDSEGANGQKKDKKDEDKGETMETSDSKA